MDSQETPRLDCLSSFVQALTLLERVCDFRATSWSRHPTTRRWVPRLPTPGSWTLTLTLDPVRQRRIGCLVKSCVLCRAAKSKASSTTVFLTDQCPGVDRRRSWPGPGVRSVQKPLGTCACFVEVKNGISPFLLPQAPAIWFAHGWGVT